MVAVESRGRQFVRRRIANGPRLGFLSGLAQGGTLFSSGGTAARPGFVPDRPGRAALQGWVNAGPRAEGFAATGRLFQRPDTGCTRLSGCADGQRSLLQFEPGEVSTTTGAGLDTPHAVGVVAVRSRVLCL